MKKLFFLSVLSFFVNITFAQINYTYSSKELLETVNESSGIILINDSIYTHNDSGGETCLYSFLPQTDSTATITAHSLSGIENNDWEEIDIDDNYIYIGDIGNNINGNRQNLQILRVERNSFYSSQPIIDTIAFSYEDQSDFSASGSNNTDFDCEAFIVTDSNIFLFSKSWVSGVTKLYSIPKIPGNYPAQLLDSINLGYLVTGAKYLENKKLLVLCGYDGPPLYMQSYVSFFFNFNDNNFFEGDKYTTDLGINFHQIEAITTKCGLLYYLTNEYAENQYTTIPSKFHIYNFDEFTELKNFLSDTTHISATICEGDSYFYSSIDTISTEGTYYFIFDDVYGCDSLVELNLSVIPIDTVEIFDTITNGSIYNSYGFLESESGLYQNSAVNSNGCDSITLLHLYVSTGESAVSDENVNNDIIIFPNPAFDSINIIIPEEDSLVKVEVFNSNAVKILEFNESSLNISNFDEGIYFIKVFTLNKIFIKKLIIN